MPEAEKGPSRFLERDGGTRAGAGLSSSMCGQGCPLITGTRERPYAPAGRGRGAGTRRKTPLAGGVLCVLGCQRQRKTRPVQENGTEAREPGRGGRVLKDLTGFKNLLGLLAATAKRKTPQAGGVL